MSIYKRPLICEHSTLYPTSSTIIWEIYGCYANQSPDNNVRTNKKGKLCTCRSHWSSCGGWKQCQLPGVSQHSQLSSYSMGQIYSSNWYPVSQRTDSGFEHTLKIRKKMYRLINICRLLCVISICSLLQFFQEVKHLKDVHAQKFPRTDFFKAFTAGRKW